MALPCAVRQLDCKVASARGGHKRLGRKAAAPQAALAVSLDAPGWRRRWAAFPRLRRMGSGPWKEAKECGE